MNIKKALYWKRRFWIVVFSFLKQVFLGFYNCLSFHLSYIGSRAAYILFHYCSQKLYKSFRSYKISMYYAPICSIATTLLRRSTKNFVPHTIRPLSTDKWGFSYNKHRFVCRDSYHTSHDWCALLVLILVHFRVLLSSNFYLPDKLRVWLSKYLENWTIFFVI